MSEEYRHQLMHANSNRAGFFDLEGCLIFDLLPRYVCPCTGLTTKTLAADLGLYLARSRLLAQNVQSRIIHQEL